MRNYNREKYLIARISESGERDEQHNPGTAVDHGHLPQSVRGLYVVS